MEQLTTTGIVSLFETTKEQRQSFCIDLVSRLEGGEVDPLKVHLQVKSMEDIIKQLNDNTVYKSMLLDAAEKHGKKFTFQNAEFSIKEVGVKYDYSQCNDPVLAELEQESARIGEALKARQNFLQTAPQSGLTIVIEATGEAATVYPPSKSSTTSVAVSLK